MSESLSHRTGGRGLLRGSGSTHETETETSARVPEIRSRPATVEKVSDRLERWFGAPGPRTLGGLIDAFGEKSFAISFIVLMAVPALPLPTGGATHVLEVIAMLLALELVSGRRTVWLPERWRRLELTDLLGGRFGTGMLRRIRWFERFSRPRLRSLLQYRLSAVLFGTIVFALSLTAFLAPPFSALDTLPALGVVVLALGILLEDFVLAIIGLVIGALGALMVVALGSLLVHWLLQLV